jgi:hypothetical protein
LYELYSFAAHEFVEPVTSGSGEHETSNKHVAGKTATPRMKPRICSPCWNHHAVLDYIAKKPAGVNRREAVFARLAAEHPVILQRR